MNDFEIGNQCYMSKDYKEARDCYERFLQTEPENYIAWHNLGVTLCQLGLDEEALAAFVLPCQHNYVESHLSRGTALRNLGKYREALLAFAHTFALDPKHPTAYSNYGNTLREFLEPELAIPFMQIARKLKPNHPNFELNECVCHLMKGDLLAGWELYESRWFFQSDVSMKPKLSGPEYDGSQNINGKYVLVYYEQGFGDNIQFSRYLKLLQVKGASVIFVTKNPTYELFKYNFPDVEVLNEESVLPGYHYHVALMALPRCFKTTIDTIPHPTPYLDVDDELKKSWQTKLGPKTKKRIGLLSSPNKVAYITKFRQIELEKLLTITSDEYEFINLSYEVDDEALALLKQHDVRDFHNDLTGFYNTAGLISQLDLVITIDTVIPHLSGALGIPTWVMLSDYGSDWRWFLNRSDSPFYNCMKLFRQNGDGKWDSVLESIKIELDNK